MLLPQLIEAGSCECQCIWRPGIWLHWPHWCQSITAVGSHYTCSVQGRPGASLFGSSAAWQQPIPAGFLDEPLADSSWEGCRVAADRVALSLPCPLLQVWLKNCVTISRSCISWQKFTQKLYKSVETFAAEFYRGCVLSGLFLRVAESLPLPMDRSTYNQ